MADLHHALIGIGQTEQLIGFRQGGSQRLFDEHIDTGCHQCRGHGAMMQRRNRHGCGFHASEKLFHGSQRGAAKLAGHSLGLGRVAIHHGNKFHAGALLLQVVINARMIAAEGAYTNDCHPNWTSVSQALIFSDVGQSGKGYHQDAGEEYRMGRAFGFISLIIVVGIGAYIYMRQTKDVMSAGSSTPTATVGLIGVRNDLLAIAQAERSHAATQGGYVSIEALRSQGDLTMTRDNRGPYNYSAEISDGSFRILATYSGPENSGMPKTLSVDQTMQVSQQ
jgi:hypothetical protein